MSFRSTKRLIEKNFVIIAIPLVILSAFLFGFVGIKGVPIPIIYNLAGEDIEPTASSVVIIENVTESPTPLPTPSPTPSPTVIETPLPLIDTALKLKEHRILKRNNVSGLKNIEVLQTIYDYKTMDHYIWYSNSNGKTYTEYAPRGFEFAFIFANIYSVNASDRIEMPRPHEYHMYAGDKEIDMDIIYQPDIAIKEFEDIYNLNDDIRVKPYGYHWEYSPSANSTDRAVGNGGWVAVENTVLRTGKSNAEDGYIIYLKPKNINDGIRVCNNLLGESACWKIT